MEGKEEEVKTPIEVESKLSRRLALCAELGIDNCIPVKREPKFVHSTIMSEEDTEKWKVLSKKPTRLVWNFDTSRSDCIVEQVIKKKVPEVRSETVEFFEEKKNFGESIKEDMNEEEIVVKQEDIVGSPAIVDNLPDVVLSPVNPQLQYLYEGEDGPILDPEIDLSLLLAASASKEEDNNRDNEREAILLARLMDPRYSVRSSVPCAPIIDDIDVEDSIEDYLSDLVVNDEKLKKEEIVNIARLDFTKTAMEDCDMASDRYLDKIKFGENAEGQLYAFYSMSVERDIEIECPTAPMSEYVLEVAPRGNKSSFSRNLGSPRDEYQCYVGGRTFRDATSKFQWVLSVMREKDHRYMDIPLKIEYDVFGIIYLRNVDDQEFQEHYNRLVYFFGSYIKQARFVGEGLAIYNYAHNAIVDTLAYYYQDYSYAKLWRGKEECVKVENLVVCNRLDVPLSSEIVIDWGYDFRGRMLIQDYSYTHSRWLQTQLKNRIGTEVWGKELDYKMLRWVEASSGNGFVLSSWIDIRSEHHHDYSLFRIENRNRLEYALPTMHSVRIAGVMSVFSRFIIFVNFLSDYAVGFVLLPEGRETSEEDLTAREYDHINSDVY